TNPLAAPSSPISELMRFSAQSGDLLHRVKVEGQVTHVRDGVYFLMGGTNGLKFRARAPLPAGVGDFVAVSGYQDLAERSPALREAIVQRQGHADLPKPITCTVADLMTGRLNAARVLLVARILSLHTNGNDRLLDLQSDLRSFQARLSTSAGQ